MFEVRLVVHLFPYLEGGTTHNNIRVSCSMLSLSSPRSAVLFSELGKMMLHEVWVTLEFVVRWLLTYSSHASARFNLAYHPSASKLSLMHFKTSAYILFDILFTFIIFKCGIFHEREKLQMNQVPAQWTRLI